MSTTVHVKQTLNSYHPFGGIMVFRKKILTSIVLAFPLLSSTIYGSSSSSSSSSSDSNLNLESLRQQCLQLRQNQQLKPFQIRVECSGRYSYWMEQQNEMSLQNGVKTFAKTSTKCGKFQTDDSMFQREGEPTTSQCNSYAKMELSTPNDMSIPVMVSSCDELQKENLENLCTQKVRDYCEANNSSVVVQSMSSSSDLDNECMDYDGMCQLKEIDRINTCTSYQ